MTRRRPALGQLVFRFLIEWLPLEPPRPPPAPPLPGGWWRRRREGHRTRQERSERRDDWTITRWVNKGVGCVLCRRWPATIHHKIGHRLLLVCGACDRRPDTLARLTEIVAVDWEPAREEC
jgi:hypothetical protein